MAIVTAEMNATVWKFTVVEGQHVEAGDVIAILESMKMEIPVESTSAGTVHFLVLEGSEIAEAGAIAEVTAQ
jgi:biotin carboxyl carrier protein